MHLTNSVLSALTSVLVFLLLFDTVLETSRKKKSVCHRTEPEGSLTWPKILIRNVYINTAHKLPNRNVFNYIKCEKVAL